MARGEGRQPRQPREGHYYYRAWSRREKPRCRRSSFSRNPVRETWRPRGSRRSRSCLRRRWWFSSRRSHKRPQSKTRAAGSSDASRRMFPTARSMGSQKAAGGNDRGLTGAGDTKSTLFIDNLSREVDSKAIRWLLRMDNDISQIVISRKRRPNNVLAFALVHLRNDARVEEALGRIHGRLFLGHKLFARRAKYSFVKDRRHRPLGNKGKGGASSSSGVSGKSEGDNSHGQMNTPVTETQGAAPEKRGGDSGGEDLGGPGDTGMLVPAGSGGACLEGDGDQVPSSEIRDGQKHFLFKCCCRVNAFRGPEETSPCSKGEKAHAKVEVGMSDGGYPMGGLTNCVWSGSSMPYCWWYPVVGYWFGYPTLGFDQSGWWGQPQGWGLWPFYSSLNYYQAASVQQPPPPTPPNVQNSNDEVNRNPCQGPMGTDVRMPVSIRQPISGKGSGPDPVMEDIVNKAKGGMEEDAHCFDKLRNDMDVGFGPGQNGNGSGDLGLRPGSEYGDPQAQALEEDLEDVGLRSLFEEPEFPPGFEPAAPSEQEDEPDDDPEESIVKKEARQTLIFAKRLGCTVPNEKLALYNYEEIIRKQRTSLRRTGQVESDESIEESDRCSRSTSNVRGKRARGTGPLGFSKFSRASKVAMRGKKKTK